MSDISVLGCGKMGSALIETLVEANTHVTIWNRTREKAEALAGSQVTVADTAGAALEGSPVTLICISNYDDTRTLLEGNEERLRGKVVVQLSSGTPDEARELGRRVTEAGGAYVDGAILAYPDDVGTDSLLIYYSGDSEAFEESRPLLERLGGTATFVGGDPGEASVRESVLLLPYTPMAVGLWQGAKICELEGVPLDWYEETVQQLWPIMIEDTFRKAKEPDFATNPEKIEGTVRRVAGYTADEAEYLRDKDLDAGMYDALHRLFAAGVEEGRGDHDWCCAAELQADHPEPPS